MTTGNCDPGCGSADSVGFSLPPEAPARYANETAILAEARRIAEEQLLPNAQTSDLADGPNQANFQALASAGLLGLGLPTEWGGLNASGTTQRDYTETIAAACGVTCFVQAQHHGPSRMILNGPNELLKQTLLPELASGRMLCAVSFAHLRRPGPPVLRAEPVPGGYRLYGTAPWVTGWGLMNQVVFGATLPDDRFVYLWSPDTPERFPVLFADNGPDNGDWGELNASPPLRLCAMNASATVELTLRGWFVPESHRLHESDRETMRCNDRNGVLGATPMPLGCARAGVRLLCETAERRNLPAVHRAAESFSQEWRETKEAVLEWGGHTSEPEFFERAVALRVRCIDLAMRTAHAAIAAASGSANNVTHPAQRLLREALFYTVQAQTQEVMAATLERLEQSARP